MQQTVHDSLYGQIQVPGWIQDLLSSSEILRLCDVSHCALPLQMSRHFSSDGGSKYVHTRGLGYLGLEATEAIRAHSPRALGADMARLLVIAIIWHDAGTPPFSHITEKIMCLLGQLGMNHEERATQMLPGSEFAQIAGLNANQIECVQKLVTGQLPPYSDLINGVLDLDTLDGVLRFATATGYRHQGQEYQPVKIARGFRITPDHNQCYLQLGNGLATQIEAYARARATTWDLLYHTLHRSPESMLHRAIALAAARGGIPRAFYNMTDEAALCFLENRCGTYVQNLVWKAIKKPYARVFSRVAEKGEVSYLRFLAAKGSHLADMVCREFRLPPDAVCAYAGRHGRTKPTEKLLVREGRDSLRRYGHQLFSEHWGAHVFMADQYCTAARIEDIGAFVREMMEFYGSEARTSEAAVVNS